MFLSTDFLFSSSDWDNILGDITRLGLLSKCMYPGFAFLLPEHLINNKLQKPLIYVVRMEKSVFSFAFYEVLIQNSKKVFIFHLVEVVYCSSRMLWFC